MKALASYRQMRAEGPEVDSEGSWAISYGDMITLLLTFFILFFNTNKKTESKTVQQALMARLERSLTKNEGGLAPTIVSANEATSAVDEELRKNLGAKVMSVGSKIIGEFPNVSFFKSGHTELTKEGLQELKSFADAFVPYAGAQRIVIRAYTDEKTVRVGEGYNRPFKNNMELSVLRAVATARSLQTDGVPLSRLMPGGFGEMRMLAGGQVDNSLARKVVLIVEPIPVESK